MDLNEINVFIKIVQTGSFSQAAKLLQMPNSTVSHKVSTLEKRLGLTLIQRTTRKLHITPAGLAYFKRCLQGLEEIRAAEQEIAASQGEPQGLLRVTGPVELNGGALPEVISEYMRRFPKVQIEVLLTGRRIDLLSEGVDLAIRAGDLKDSTLIAKKIGSVYFALFATAKYLKNKETPKHPRDLRQHRCIQFTPVGHDEWKLTGPQGAYNVALSGPYWVDDLMLAKRLALQGEGIAFLPSHLCTGEVDRGKLVRILPEWRSNLTPIHFVYASQKFVTPKLQSFMEIALEPLRKSFEAKV